MKNLFAIIAILISLFSKAADKPKIDDPCTSITFPYTLVGANNNELIANLRQAILCANANGNTVVDVIDLNGYNLSAENSYDNTVNGSFPGIHSKIELRNGVINRASAVNFRFFYIYLGNSLTLNNIVLSNGYGSGITVDGGAIYNEGTLNIYNSKLIGNTSPSSGFGGAIFSSNGSTLNIVNSLISGNKAGTGAAIRNRGNATLTNVTIAGNFAAINGGGIANSGTYGLTLNNTLIFGNESVANANVDGSYNNNSSLVGIDPSFVNALDASDSAPTTEGDYSLNLLSVAIDAGTSNLINIADYPKDLAGLQRISGTKIDIGAYEFSFETLPVKLQTFIAKKEASYIKLNWSTSFEENNDKYIVFRAGDEKEFFKIGEIKAQPYPNKNNSYIFYDQKPISGNNYYRLIQKDKDGKENNLGEKAVTFALETIFNVFPNPTKDKVNVYFDKGDYDVLTLLNIDGNILEKTKLSSIQQEAKVNLTSLPSGVYVIQLVGKKDKVMKKIIKK